MISNLLNIEIHGIIGTTSSTRMGKPLVFEWIHLSLKGLLRKGPRIRKHIPFITLKPLLYGEIIIQKSRPNPLKVNTKSTVKLLFAYVIDFVCFLIFSIERSSSVKNFCLPTVFLSCLAEIIVSWSDRDE